MKFMYYYLKSVQHIIEENYQKGSCNKSLDVEMLNTHMVPLPPVEVQCRIVEYMDFLLETCEKTSLQKIQELKETNRRIIQHHLRTSHGEPKYLGEICDTSVHGNVNSKASMPAGEYPFYKASATNPQGFHNTYCFNGEEYLLFVKSGGNSKNPVSESHGIGKVHLCGGKTCGNTEVVMLNFVDVCTRYMYHLLSYRLPDIQMMATYCTGLGHINMDEFRNMKILVPSLETQEKISKECDENNARILDLELQITQNRNTAKSYLTSFIVA
jgi:restriction endonuclease S subunit